MLLWPLCSWYPRILIFRFSLRLKEQFLYLPSAELSCAPAYLPLPSLTPDPMERSVVRHVVDATLSPLSHQDHLADDVLLAALVLDKYPPMQDAADAFAWLDESAMAGEAAPYRRLPPSRREPQRPCATCSSCNPSHA